MRIKYDWYTYEINTNKNTAEVYKAMCIAKIPQSITYNSQEYIVTGFKEGSFTSTQFDHDSIFISEDINITSFGKNIFKNSYYLQEFNIPKNVNKFDDGWCKGLKNIKNISISTSNKNFLCIDNKLIIGKSSQKTETYDLLLFACRDIRCVSIPPYIKHISPYCFSDCKKLYEIQFSENSELLSIGKNAFSHSAIRYLQIPSSLKQLKDGWCKYAKNLNFVSVSSKNKNFKCLDNKIIFGKSDMNTDLFDVLFFSSREIRRIKVPSCIKHISSFCFSDCQNLELIEFDEDSELETIGKGCFYKTQIESLFVPSHLKTLKNGWCEKTSKLIKLSISPNNKNFKLINDKMLIGKSNENNDYFDVLLFACRNIKHVKVPSYIKYISPYCFSDCLMIESIEFEQNSKLIFIGNNSFSNSSIESIIIPKDVKEIGKSSFYCCKNLKTIEFDDDSKIETIEEKTFYQSTLKRIKIPDSVKIIKKKSFESCLQLTDVIISDMSKLEIIEEQSFKGSLLNEIKIPQHVKRIGPKAFCFCEYLQNVDISKDSELISIEEFAFSNTSISQIFIPKQTEMIHYNAFSQCMSLKSVKFQENSQLFFIGHHAFYSSSIKEICIPSHVKYIEKDAFDYCRNLEVLTFEENSELESIACIRNFFEDLTILYIPGNIKKFDPNDFYSHNHFLDISVSPINKNFSTIDNKILLGKSNQNNEEFDTLILVCPDVENIIIQSFIKYISSNCFKCKNLKTIQFAKHSKLAFIGKQSFQDQLFEYIKIPKHVKRIDDKAFHFCKNLHTIEFEEYSELEFIGENAFSYTSINHITIPKNVKKIGKFAFSNCKKLQSIDFSEDSVLEFIGDGAFESTQVVQIKGSFSNTENFFTILNNEMIVYKSNRSNNSFDTLLFACRNIINIRIPFYIKYISPNCFSECTNIESIEFEENSELISFGNDSFRNSSIESIIVPKNVRIIGDRAFQNCTKLKTIKFSENSEMERIGKAAFFSSSIEYIEIPDNIKEIKNMTFRSCCNLKTVKFSNESKLMIIEKHAFSQSSIESINIPAHVQKIGESAFYSCSNLTTVTFAKNSELTRIKYSAFTYSNIEGIIIPKNVKIIENTAFSDCANLKYVEFEKDSKLETIYPYTFRLTSFEKFKVPSSVKQILEGAFFMSNLQLIEFEENSELEFIDFGSFGKTPLTEINLPSKVDLVQQWCTESNELSKISISPENKKFKCIENSMLLKKSIPTIQNFDVLFSVSNNIKHVKIPSYIKYIDSNCFSFNNNLEIIEFSKDSELLSIPKSVFINSSLKEITIPAHVKRIKKVFQDCRPAKVNLISNSELNIIGKNEFRGSYLNIHENLKELKDGWCMKVPNLKYITISPKNKYFALINDKMIIGKSNPFNEGIFDVLLFACRDIRHAKIPSYIKHISPYCFSDCKNLHSIEFEKNSELLSIGEYAFSECSLKNIHIPNKCNKIGQYCFASTFNIRYIEFDENSEIDFIPFNSFESSHIKNIIIPKNVKIIGNKEFSNCMDLKSCIFLSEEVFIHHNCFEIQSSVIVELPNALKVHFSANDIPNLIIMMKSGAEVISIFMKNLSLVRC